MIPQVEKWKYTRYECSMLTSHMGLPSNSTRRFPLIVGLSETPQKTKVYKQFMDEHHNRLILEQVTS